MIRTHKFAGRKFKIDFNGYDGFCETPEKPPSPTVYILDGLKPTKQCLDTIIHEGIHAIDENIGEEKVTLLAAELAGWLWRLGYRLK